VTPREFFAIAVMLSTNFDERMMAQAEESARWARSTYERAEWARWRDEDAQRIGAKRALWLDVYG